MPEDTRIRKVIREISRMGKSKEQAFALVEDLLCVDWQKILDNDLIACYRCQRDFRYCDMVWHKRNADVTLPHCPSCAQGLHPYKCYNCTQVFYASYNYPSHICEHCRSKACIACKNLHVPHHNHRNTLCQSCYDKRKIPWTWESEMQNRLNGHHKRAKEKGLPATLSFNGWIETLEYFDWHCAYCIVNSYSDLDHFIPIAKGGGTTKNNCIPSCDTCNSRKSQSHPKDITFVHSEVVSSIQKYLASV